MLKRGIAVGLGTDGPAGSNNDFNMFEEMDLAAKLQKLVRRDPEALPARQAFEMATIDGARALGMEKEIGSLEPGKRADMIVVSLREPTPCRCMTLTRSWSTRSKARMWRTSSSTGAL